MIYEAGDFDLIRRRLHWRLIEEAPQVDTGHWQSLKDVPHTATRELPYVTIETPIPATQGEAHLIVEPNMPWAEDHFQERVSRDPTNPGVEFANWPWYTPGWEAQDDDDDEGFGRFSHTYQERLWPKRAGKSDDRLCRNYGRDIHRGIWYDYGDLDDVVKLIAREPHTRQAYLPMWFPEDTGAVHGGRVPCSLGWHFMVRDDRLNVVYYMRSIDFLRYFADDVYMTMRLGQWVVHELTRYPPDGGTAFANLTVGTLIMHMSSLHIFEREIDSFIRNAPEKP